MSRLRSYYELNDYSICFDSFTKRSYYKRWKTKYYEYQWLSITLQPSKEYKLIII